MAVLPFSTTINSLLLILLLFLPFIPGTSVMAQGDALLAVCQALSNALPGKLSMPNSDPYTSSLRSYFSLQEGELAPSCVLQPANAQEVAAAVKVLATTPSLKFAVRGGGHTVWAGSANIQNGVTIDMRLINNVEVSADKSYTSVGAGALWRDVYTVLDEQGLATSGGRASQVGVGGLTTGGTVLAPS